MTNRVLVLAAAVWAALAGCKSNDVEETNSQVTNNSAGDVIGASGGTLEDRVHGSKVLFPAGAVTEPTQFELGAVEGIDPPDGLKLASVVFSFQPHGFVFHGPVNVVLPYQGDDANVTVRHASCDAKTNVCQPWDEAPVGGVQVQNGTVAFSTPSFSLYAVTVVDGCTGSMCPSGEFCGTKDGKPACVKCEVGAACAGPECGACGLVCVAGACAAP
jgi:hypothetical protein